MNGAPYADSYRDFGQDADHVTLQLARHLPVRDYADIIAALQVLFRHVEGSVVINPTEMHQEVREFLRVMLRPIARRH